MVNQARHFSGVQVGLVNWTNHLKGIQLGLLNHAGNSSMFHTLPVANAAF
ncbi:MAG: hypothetical protein JRI68_09290 [Deltaproteobacteria bacterium]|nr:hypothetical protein [Deltaproteobacteria bacterium]